jgi:hypothetical protein
MTENNENLYVVSIENQQTGEIKVWVVNENIARDVWVALAGIDPALVLSTSEAHATDKGEVREITVPSEGVGCGDPNCCQNE